MVDCPATFPALGDSIFESPNRSFQQDDHNQQSNNPYDYMPSTPRPHAGRRVISIQSSKRVLAQLEMPEAPSLTTMTTTTAEGAAGAAVDSRKIHRSSTRLPFRTSAVHSEPFQQALERMRNGAALQRLLRERQRQEREEQELLEDESRQEEDDVGLDEQAQAWTLKRVREVLENQHSSSQRQRDDRGDNHHHHHNGSGNDVDANVHGSPSASGETATIVKTPLDGVAPPMPERYQRRNSARAA